MEQIDARPIGFGLDFACVDVVELRVYVLQLVTIFGVEVATTRGIGDGSQRQLVQHLFAGSDRVSDTNNMDRDGDGTPDHCERQFIRGDVDGSTVVDLNDSIVLLTLLFLGPNSLPPGVNPPDCEDASDADDSGLIDSNDAIFSLSYLLLRNQPPPPAPGPDGCGHDPTPDVLGCELFPACESAS